MFTYEAFPIRLQRYDQPASSPEDISPEIYDAVVKYSLSPEINEGLKKLEVENLGKAMTLVTGTFARSVNNKQLLDFAVKSGLPPEALEAAAQAIKSTGFENRFISGDLLEASTIENVIARTALINAILLRKVMAEKKWKTIDTYIDTSSFLPFNINKLTLQLAGFKPKEIKRIVSRSYRFACAGWTAAFFDSLEEKDLDKKIVIASSEPLSYLFKKEHLQSPEGILIPAIFGDRYLVSAFQRKAFNPLVRRIKIFPDGGVIKLPTFYNFEDMANNPDILSSYYEFEDNPRVDTHAKSILRFDGAHAAVQIQSPENNIIEMNGKRTGGVFFLKTSQEAKITIDTYGDKRILINLNGYNTIIHPASFQVLQHILEKLQKEGYLIEIPDLFTPLKCLHSNSSSATTPKVLMDQIKKGNIDTGLPLVFFTPGIGAVIATGIIEINEDFR